MIYTSTMNGSAMPVFFNTGEFEDFQKEFGGRK